METVRKPAVAGLFYPAVSAELAASVDAFLDEAPASRPFTRLVIAPHAGHRYSGRFAAPAYKALSRDTKKVVILGPTHRVGIEGMALAGAQWHETPLGKIKTDTELTNMLEELDEVITAPLVHSQEHSIEVHLPFLQRHLDDFTVVPVAVGDATPQAVSQLISRVWQDPDAAILVSSDLSHYLHDSEARIQDEETLRQISSLRWPVRPDQACGARPISGLLHFAEQRGLRAAVLASGNSSDTAGDRSRVVGYASVAYYDDGLPETLLQIARDAIGIGGQGATTAEAQMTSGAALMAHGASFVTLTIDGQLRGCIGSLRPIRPLGEDVAYNAKAAAFRDPRFPPLTVGELDFLEIGISLLQPPRSLFTGPVQEAEAIAALRPFEHGVVWRSPGHRATFLPHVWAELPEPTQFLTQLKRKAGVPEDYWGEDVALETYTVQEIKGPAVVGRSRV